MTKPLLPLRKEKSNMNNFNLHEVQTVTYSFNILRIKNDLAFHQKEMERTKAQTIGEKDAFFQKLGKDFSNTINKTTYEINEKEFALKSEHLAKIEKFTAENNIEVISDLTELSEYINDLFKDDIADIRAVFVAFNLIFTSPYYGTDIQESMKKETFNEIGDALKLPKNFFVDYEKDLLKKYHLISGKNPSDLLADALLVGSLAGIVAFFISPVLGVLTAGAVTTLTLGGMISAGVIVGVLSGSVRYAGNISQNRSEIRKAFKNMNAEETDFMLLQKLAVIEALLKYQGEKEVDETLQALIDELINLKSDLDLALYGFRENKDNINARKKESFHRFDKYLLKILKI